MKVYAQRLLPGQDIKAELIKFTHENNIRAGFIITCVGCVQKATLRMANAQVVKNFDGTHEIVSLVGTLCPDDVHLHLSISDVNGNTYGGHMKEGCVVFTTAEIIIGEMEDTVFTREFSEETGYKELKIQTR